MVINHGVHIFVLIMFINLVYGENNVIFIFKQNHVKQSSNNIFCNVPRASVNFNDGFPGGSKLMKHILNNTCRESSDHGNSNPWDRQAYYTKAASNSETTGTTKAYDEIGYNFMM